MTKRSDNLPSHPSVQVLERMFNLLEVLASREEAISLKEISEKTGLHPSTAHRILNDLTIGRFVDRPEAGSYRLGMRLLELGNLVKGRLNVRDAAPDGSWILMEYVEGGMWTPPRLQAPEGLREVLITGGLAPVTGRSVDEVYAATWVRTSSAVSADPGTRRTTALTRSPSLSPADESPPT